METINKNSEQYQNAEKKLGEIKGFYIHLVIYLLVNIFIIIQNYRFSESILNSIFNWSVLGTGFFWGIGLFSHWSRVFGKNIFFNKKWEEKKIKEFMETKTSNKWE